MKPLSHICFLLFLYLFISVSLFAQPGTLATSFGNNGTLTDPSRQYFEKAIAAQGKNIVIGSQGFYQGVTTFMVDRLLPDGTKDNTFGTGGTTFILFANSNNTGYINSRINAIAILAGGNILTAGDATGGRGTIALARFLPDGKPDSSFGSNGTSLTGFNNNETIAGMAIQPDGKIVVCGNTVLDFSSTGNRFFTARYLPDGSIDSSFGKNGIVVSNSSGSANAVIVQPDGSIVSGGYNTAADGIYFHTERYHTDGSYDVSFGTNGIVDSRINGGFLNFINDIALQKDNKIIAAGKTNGGDTQTFTVVRYNSDGSFDNSFGSGGVVLTPFAGNIGEAEKIMITTNGEHIIVAGSSTGSQGGDFALASYYNTDGSLDTTFGNAGINITNFGGSDFDNSATLCADGAVVALGNNTGQYPFTVRALVKYDGYPVSVSLFVKIKRWLQNHTLSWNGLPADDNIAYYTVEQSSHATTGFAPIATISGFSQAKEYSNNKLLPGMNYYRIKAISTDGAVWQSEVVGADNTVSSLSVYPNPAKDFVLVKGLTADVTSTISITNSNGNVLKQDINYGSIQHRLLINDLQPGTYYINVITLGGNKEVVTFMKQ